MEIKQRERGGGVIWIWKREEAICLYRGVIVGKKIFGKVGRVWQCSPVN